jgi:hypothetical protein
MTSFYELNHPFDSGLGVQFHHHDRQRRVAQRQRRDGVWVWKKAFVNTTSEKLVIKNYF